MEVLGIVVGLIGIGVGGAFWYRWSANNKAMGLERKEFETKIGQLEGRRRKTERRLEELTDQSKRLERDLRIAVERREQKATAQAIWELEIARAERRWREVVVPGDVETHLDATAGERLSQAIEQDVERLREEVGVSIRFEGAIDCDLDPESAVGGLRIAEEILALASRNADEIAVVVDQEISANDGGTLIAIDVTCEGWEDEVLTESDIVLNNIKTMAQRLDGWASCERNGQSVVLKSRVPAGPKTLNNNEREEQDQTTGS